MIRHRYPAMDSMANPEGGSKKKQPASKKRKSDSKKKASSKKKGGSRKKKQDDVPVTAVLLKPCGAAVEIQYDVTLGTTIRLLNGRHEFMGELEDARIVIVRAHDRYQSRCGARNQHTLPAPFGGARFNGNYLLFRVDAEGDAVDLSLTDYIAYVAQHPAEPPKANPQGGSKKKKRKSASKRRPYKLRTPVPAQVKDDVWYWVSPQQSRND